MSVTRGFAKNQVIGGSKTAIRIIYRGRGLDSEERLLPNNKLLEEYDGPIYNFVCDKNRHNDGSQCKCPNELTIIQLDRALFHKLCLQNASLAEYDMACFLSSVDFIQKLKNDQCQELAKFCHTQIYKKGEKVLQLSDFPLDRFCIVKAGTLELTKIIQTSESNFIPVTKDGYEKVTKTKAYQHVLSTVRRH